MVMLRGSQCGTSDTVTRCAGEPDEGGDEGTCDAEQCRGEARRGGHETGGEDRNGGDFRRWREKRPRDGEEGRAQRCSDGGDLERYEWRTGCGGDGGDDSSGGEADEGPRVGHGWTGARLQVFHSQLGNCERTLVARRPLPAASRAR
ncbi:hypothetical protein E2C01_069894 [Portunus trituberculatus]|uniref:Uncharacterized protein n=1 Tax=Portunus trituberculatus TaxID=210409 RepID=A0A5B7I406_PORTR|nr:hypothetical protein [Portunus trituberculatus]